MAKNIISKIWEEKAKYQNRFCLCYNEENGLFTNIFGNGTSKDELLYSPHGIIGWVDDAIKIPDTQLSIRIKSNFGYGRSSYLRATLYNKELEVLDFNNEKLYILNGCSVRYVSAPDYEWNELFKQIIQKYRQAFSYEEYSNAFLSYVDELKAMLNKEDLEIRTRIGEDGISKRKGDILLLSYLGRKIADLITGLKFSIPIKDKIVKHLIPLCCQYTSKVSSASLDFHDPRVSKISEYLLSVHSFMMEHGEGAEYLVQLCK